MSPAPPNKQSPLEGTAEKRDLERRFALAWIVLARRSRARLEPVAIAGVSDAGVVESLRGSRDTR